MLELTDRFQEWLTLDITHSTAYFDDGNVSFIFVVIAVKTTFDLICNMRDNLYRTSAEISPALFVKNGPVNLSGGNVGILGQALIDKTFIMSQIQVCLCTIVCNKDFSVLDWVHGTWVNIDIWVKFLHGDFIAAGLQETSKRCSGDTLPKTGYNTTGYKYIFYWHNQFLLKSYLFSILTDTMQKHLAGQWGMNSCFESAKRV